MRVRVGFHAMAFESMKLSVNLMMNDLIAWEFQRTCADAREHERTD